MCLASQISQFKSTYPFIPAELNQQIQRFCKKLGFLPTFWFFILPLIMRHYVFKNGGEVPGTNLA